jgi:carbon starvation protein
MNGIVLLIVSIVILIVAYITYGKFLAKRWGVDPTRRTPAVELEDGVDYVPTGAQVVFGHQFASIAGAGPINGPIQAAIFGWLPVVLWILVGGIFIGAVQDFGSIFASVRNKGRSIGYIIEIYIGKVGKRLFLLFVWLFSILVIAAFSDIVAGTFAGYGADGSRSIVNGSTASTSIAFMGFAFLLGIYMKRRRPSALRSNLVAIVLLVTSIILGMAFPTFIPKQIWMYLVFAYIFLASVLPVWVLLQPRDYLNSFLLVFMMLAAMVGIFIANPTIHLPAFLGFTIGGQHLFPILFVTVACGAVSGFHSLISSETSSKQIRNEKDMLPVTFGAMLVECLLAIIALICAGAVASQGVLPAGTPPQIFALAVASFLTKAGIPSLASTTIITLAISAFALTSLDSVARVGRLSFQELFLDNSTDDQHMPRIQKLLTNTYFATGITLFLGFMLAKIGYRHIWPLFGSANQMIGALALCAIAIFLRKTQKGGAMTWIPMLVMLAITFTALGQIIVQKSARILNGSFGILNDGMQLVFALLLIGLAVVIAYKSIKSLFFNSKTATAAGEQM